MGKTHTTLDLIKLALEEDIGTGDATTLATVPEDKVSRGVIRAKQSGVICGLEVARQTFEIYDENVSFSAEVKDGDYVKAGTEIAYVEGPSRSLLTSERTALNFLQQLSGVATETRKYVEAMGETDTKLLDTRKTIPCYRELQKYAVKCGGGTNHRMGLYDLIMIKDNHIEAAGGIAAAIRAAKASKYDLRVEVECKNISEVADAQREGVDIIMLDNMSSEMAGRIIMLIDGDAEVEISGGITLETIADYAHIRADYISVGALTHHINSLDISMDFEN